MEERQINILILLLSIIFFFCSLLLAFLGIGNTRWIAREIMKHWKESQETISKTQQETLNLLNDVNATSRSTQEQCERLVKETLEKMEGNKDENS